MNLNLSDINFSSKSMMDDFGRVFFMDNKVFRAIRNDKKSYCLALINSDLFTELQHNELIPETHITEYSLEGYDLVLEHEKLAETLIHEWSFTMLKDASQMVLQVNELCRKHGYELKDAHSLNILFKGTKPVWVDIGSISPAEKLHPDGWTAYPEFVASLIIPLLFWSEGNIYITRKLLESNFHRVDVLPTQAMVQSELLSLLRKKIRIFKFSFFKVHLFSTKNETRLLTFKKRIVNKILNGLTGRSNTQFISYSPEYVSYEKVKSILNNLETPLVSSTWQNYHSHYYSDNGKLASSPRMNRVIELIKSKSGQINSVIDLAGNQGLVCKQILENTGIKNITLTDYDANAIDFAYTSFKNENINNINLLLLNFMFTRDLKDTANRVKSDLAMALAVTHHLVLTANYSLEAIFERVKMYSNKFVMIEFMPLGLWAIGDKNLPVIPDWYNEKWFQTTFEKYFKLIIREKLEENRIVFFGEIIS